MTQLRRSNWRKISVEQRHQLVQIFLHMGYAESVRVCIEAGLHGKYAALQAREMGLSRKKVFRGGGDIANSIDHNDHRWAWAIERGSVIA